MKKEELPKTNATGTENAFTKTEPRGLFRRNKAITTLLILLGIITLAAFVSIRIMQSKSEKQQNELKKEYENKIDSLTARQLVLTTKVFSWAIRSELTRDNKEQVNQFFLNFIKESGVSNVKYVDARTSKITIATNKKDDGATFTDQVALMTTETIHYTNDSMLYVISPVMNLNSKIGILVIEYDIARKSTAL